MLVFRLAMKAIKEIQKYFYVTQMYLKKSFFNESAHP